MTNTERFARLKYEVAPKGFDALEKGFAQLHRNQELARERGLALAAAYKQAGASAATALDNAAIRQQQRDWDKTLASVERYVDELDEAGKEAKQLRDNLDAAQNRNVQLAGSAGRTTAGLRSLSRAAGLGGAAQALDIGSDIAELTEELPKLKQSLAALPDAAKSAAIALGGGSLGVGIGIVGALAVASVAVIALTNAYNESKTAADRRNKAELDYIEIIKTSTTIEIQEKLKSLEVTRQIQQLQADNAAQKLAEGMREVLDAAPGLDMALQGITRGLFDAQAASDSEAFTKANEGLKETTALIDIYTKALDSQEVALNDNVQQFQAFLDEAYAFTDMLNAVQISAQTGAFSATSEGIKNTVAQLTLEREERQKAIDAQILSADVLKEYQKRIQEIDATILESNRTLPAIILRELDAASKATGEKLAQIEADNAEKRADALKTKLSAISDAETDAAFQRSENERKADIDREKEQERHEKALAKIQRDYNSARTNAIQDRDVLALQAAKDARREALRNERESNQDRKDAINDALREQNRAIDIRLAEQKRTIEKRYDDQVAAAQAAADKATAVEKKRYDDLLTTTQTGSDALLAAWRNFLMQAQAQTQAAASGQALPATAPVAPSEPQTQSARQLLDRAPLTPIGYGALPGGNRGGSTTHNSTQITIPVNVNGRRQRDIEVTTKDAVHRELDRILREAGIK